MARQIVKIHSAPHTCPACSDPNSAAPGLTKTIFLKNQSGSAKLISLIATCVAVALLLTLFLLSRRSAHEPERTPLSAAEVQALSAKAQAGDAAAQATLGAAYSKGDGVKQDYKQAAQWYQKAAALGNASAQSALGELFEAGQGVPRDEAQAAAWYRRAADQGLAAAQYNLAALYNSGKGVPFNNAEALKWYLQAANQGDSLAQYNVGMRYSEGHGVAADPVVAFKWLSLSAAQGLPDAEQALTLLKGRLSSDQVTKGRELVRDFKPISSAKP